MSVKLMPVMFALALVSAAQVFAAPAPRAFDAFVEKVARETGRKEDDVRNEAVDALRREGKFSETELQRIGRDERTSDERVEMAMVRTLEKSELSPIESVLDAIREPQIEVTAGGAFDSMKIASNTVGQLDEVRFQEMPEPIIRQNLRKIIDADEELGKLSGDQKERLVNELLNGLNARVAAAELIKRIETENGGVSTLELTKHLQSQWVELLLKDAPHALATTAEGKFTLRAVARDFPPYGRTYMGEVTINGKTIEITDTDLIKATFEQAGDLRPSQVQVLSGTIKAERIAREFPPYGVTERLEMVVVRPPLRGNKALHGPLEGNGRATAKTTARRGDNLISTLKTATSPALASFKTLAEKATKSVRNDSAGTVTTAYRIKAEKRSGETTEDLITRVVKYSLHRDFSITGDDGGYSFKQLEKNVTAEQLDRDARDMTWLFSDDSTVDADAVKAALLKAAHKGLVVLLGSGSGNNTMADIAVVADPENMEFVVLMNSNFGSDN